MSAGAKLSPEWFGKLIVSHGARFAGLVETQPNARWDNPKTPGDDTDENVFLRTWMAKVSGWTPGAPYCAAFDGAVVAYTLYSLGLKWRKFLALWTAHVMTNVSALRQRGILSTVPVEGALWLAKNTAARNYNTGHAGIVVAVNRTQMTTLEANTSSSSTGSQREGEGIWFKTQRITGRASLLTQGFLTPASILALAK